MRWVSENQDLVRQMAHTYRRHMLAENADLMQEATIAAFKAIKASRRKGQPGELQRFFRVIFKTNCIKLASGVQTAECPEIHKLPLSDEQHDEEEVFDRKEIEKALKRMTRRQREVCNWLLTQPEPVSIPAIARQFQITTRQACRLINCSIKRIEKRRKK